VNLVVADASAIAEYLLGTRRSDVVRETMETLERFDVHTPHLCDVEVLSILRKAVSRGELTERRAADAVLDLVDLNLVRHEHLSLLGRVFALRDNFSAYDATYVALAERLDATLLTADAHLVRAARAHLELPVIDASTPTSR
jgi:predicted nucleic acid-binding protein